MTRYAFRLQLLAAVLAALAGFVDATGFSATGGFFVSFMSGNSTRLGLGLARGEASGLVAAGLVGAFVIGVVAGAMLAQAAGRNRSAAVLLATAAALGAAAALGGAGRLAPAVAAMAIATGVLNNVFARGGEVSIGLTYMTGSLVKLGQRLAAALLGTDRWGFLPYLLLWGSFVAGVVLGGLAFPVAGFTGLWGAGALAALLAPASLRLDTGHAAGP